MPRIYSNYTDEEFEKIKKASEEVGMSLSAYQKYATTLHLPNDTRNGTKSLPDLIKVMYSSLNVLKKGDVFIVSTLLPEDWANISDRSTKNILSQTLSKHVRSNPDKYIINQVLPNGTNQYKKIL